MFVVIELTAFQTGGHLIMVIRRAHSNPLKGRKKKRSFFKSVWDCFLYLQSIIAIMKRDVAANQSYEL